MLTSAGPKITFVAYAEPQPDRRSLLDFRYHRPASAQGRCFTLDLRWAEDQLASAGMKITFELERLAGSKTTDFEFGRLGFSLR